MSLSYIGFLLFYFYPCGPFPIAVPFARQSSEKCCEIIDTSQMNAPSFLMVLTGTGDYAYRRKDGVYVVPIGCLKN